MAEHSSIEWIDAPCRGADVALRILATADIPDSVLNELTKAWAPVGPLLPAGRVFHKAADGPSYIQIIGEVVQWVTPLKAAAIVFLSQLAKEAATETYRNKATIARALVSVAATPLRLVATALAQARLQTPRQPGLILGLSVPDDFFGTTISIGDDESEEDIAVLLALFVTLAPRIQEIVETELKAGRPPLGRVHVLRSPGGGLRLEWVDREMSEHQIDIPMNEG